MNENRITLSDTVKIEIIHSIKEILIELIDKAFSDSCTDQK